MKHKNQFLTNYEQGRRWALSYFEAKNTDSWDNKDKI